MHKIKEITLTMPLLGLFIICLLSLPAGAQYGGGTGQPDDPYLIYTAEQMNEIGANRNDWDKHFKLMADIDLSLYSGRDFNVIGTGNRNAFRGIFDGNNKKISNFIYASTNGGYKGLFGYVKDSDAEIKNLGLIEPNIDIGAGSGVGSLVGWVDAGIITNCYADGGSVSGKTWVGGLVGYNKGGEIKGCYATCVVSGNEKVGGLAGHHGGAIDDCYAAGNVSGDTQIGGLVGDNGGTISNCSATGSVSGDKNVGGLVGNNGGTISNCSATGSVSGDNNVGGLVGDNGGPITNCSAGGDVLGSGNVGGLVGINTWPEKIDCCYSIGAVIGTTDVGGLVGDNRGRITNCYPTGSTTGNDRVGGLVGMNTWPGKVSCCYSIGAVVGTTDVGGIVGFNDEAVIKTSFWNVQTSGQSNMCGRQMYSIGCNDANGKTTAAMQTERTFLNAGWDFVVETENGTEDIWWILEGQDYPRLWWDVPWASWPNPEDGATDVIQPLILHWVAGNSALDHDVYLGEDEAVVANAMTESPGIYRGRQPAEMTSYDPGTLEWGKTYYWRVDEVNNVSPDSPWIGSVWSFTTADYLIIEDFEDYDIGNNEIWWAWKDGLGYATHPTEPPYPGNGTGSAVGDEATASYCEEVIVHGGGKSMPYWYDNNKQGFLKYSEATLTLSYPRDWTEEGVEILTLWFQADPYPYFLPAANAPEQMYVAVSDSDGCTAVVYHYNPKAAQIETWTEWDIPLTEFSNQGVVLTDVETLSIGFGNRSNPQPGGSGKMFFDDIRLYRTR